MTLLIFCGESAIPTMNCQAPSSACKGSTVPGLDNSAAIALTSRCFEVSEVMSTSSPKSASASSVESMLVSSGLSCIGSFAPTVCRHREGILCLYRAFRRSARALAEDPDDRKLPQPETRSRKTLNEKVSPIERGFFSHFESLANCPRQIMSPACRAAALAPTISTASRGSVR